MTREPHNNAFDLLRLLLAAGVIVAHAYLLGGYNQSDFLYTLSKGQTNLADVSVIGFFTLSGYLITASFGRANPLSFIIHRILRVYPGYWVCLFVTGFGLATLIAHLSGLNHELHATGGTSSLNYFLRNFSIKINQWSVDNVLAKVAYQGSLNGSLWSLYPEIQCYAATLIMGMLGLFNRNRIAIPLLLGLVWMVLVAKETFNTNIGPTFLYLSNGLKLYAAYLAGMVMYVYRDKIRTDKGLIAFTGMFILLLLKFGGFNIVAPLLIAYLLIAGFSAFTFKLRYDISYGIYIYGFPLQHLLFACFGNRLPLIIFILLSFILAAVFGLLSYLLVERPFIRLKKPIDNMMNKILAKYSNNTQADA